MDFFFLRKIYSNVLIIYELSSVRQLRDLISNVVLKSNLIQSIKFGMAVARCLKQALYSLMQK